MTYSTSSPMRSGQSLVCGALASYQQADWSVQKHYAGDLLPEWRKHIGNIQSKTRGDLADPCVYFDGEKKHYCLRGSLKPKGKNYAPEGKDYVYFKNGDYKLVNMDKIEAIDDYIYDRVFRRFYDTYLPLIKTKERKNGVYVYDRDFYSIIKIVKR